jgi:hypothetical protein
MYEIRNDLRGVIFCRACGFCRSAGGQGSPIWCSLAKNKKLN